MGAGSSIIHHNDRQSERNQKKSIRDQFQKEFGTGVSEKELRVSKGGFNKEKLKTVSENGESSSELEESTGGNEESISGNGDSISGDRKISSSNSNSNSTPGSSVYHVPLAGEASPGSVNKDKLKLNAAVFRAKALFLRPVLKKRPAKDTLVVKKQNNPGLLKELYQRMDPTLNTDLTNVVVGELEVAVKFKPEDGLLLVKIGRGKDLPKEDGSPAPDPFVVVDIFPAMNPLDLTTRKTKVKNGTCNPYFQEILSFPMSQQHISDTKLRLTVWDRVSSSQLVFLGEALHDICKLDFNEGGIAWHKLYPKTDIAICGNLELSVAFKEPRSLVVTICKGNNIKVCNEEDQSSDPYARLHVTGLPTKFQTNVQYGTVNPIWMESYEFDVHPSEFSRRTIVINLLNKNSCGRDQHLGDIHIPMTEYDYQQSGVSKEYVLKDLRNTQQSKSAWSEEGLTMEFREAMKAHMIYGYPKFIFKKHHKGKMVVSCRSKKAQTQAKMVIDNGIVTMDNVQM